MQNITTLDLPGLLTNLGGLIIGPTATLHPGVSSELQAKFVPGATASSLTYWSAVRAASGALGAGKVSDALQGFFSAASGSTLLSTLASIPWPSVLSLTHDSKFDDVFRAEMKQRPHRLPVLVVDELGSPVPQRVTPVFKLLGTPGQKKLAIDDNSLLVRRAQWRQAVRHFCELGRGGVVFCVGLDESEDILREVLVDFMAGNTTKPRYFVTFSDDPLSRSKALDELVGGFSTLAVVSAPVSSLTHAFNLSKGIGQAAATQPNTLKLSQTLTRLVRVVNEYKTPVTSKTERNLLLDMLFSPDLASWEPFSHNLDFPRSVSQVVSDLRNLLNTSGFRSSAVVITGSAASGKTVLLKRVAYDLADDETVVLWLRPTVGTDNAQLITELFRKVKLVQKRVVVFMDDPPAFSALTPRDVAMAARAASLEILLVTAVRTSEWGVQDNKFFIGPLDLAMTLELPDAFDDAEWALLPSYLVRLGLYPDVSRASTAMAAIKARSSTDTLSTLYFLLNETKSTISNSVKEEYFRLGDIAGLSRVLIGQTNKTSQVLRDAYELVAVTNYHRTTLPLEILVSALDVPYGEWLDAVPPDRPSWGLLYPDADPRTEGAGYRTRNDIVTRILVSLVNGGVVSHSGEARCLERLLAACTGTSVLYREFCVKILVHNDALKSLDYGEVIRLFDAALNALPLPDRTLLHHKAIWVRDQGRDPVTALRLLEQALAAPHYPYAAKSEPDEHINNSIAATYSDLLDNGLIDVDSATTAILDHLGQARSVEFHNTFSAHVHANMILRVLKKVPKEKIVDIDALTARALSDLETTLTTVQHRAKSDPLTTSEDLNMLQSAKTKLLLKVRPLDELVTSALSQWKEYGSQSGFVVACRKLFEEARGGGKGSDYHAAWDYAEGAMKTVQDDGADPSAALAEVAVQIYYTWRVARRIPTKNQKNEIDWDLIHQLAAVASRSNRGGQDTHLKYLDAVALAHLGKWTEAESIFHALRQSRVPHHILWFERDLLLDDYGAVRQLQGVIRTVGDRTYLHAPDLGTDFLCERGAKWPRNNENALAYVAFRYGGPTAVPWYKLDLK